MKKISSVISLSFIFLFLLVSNVNSSSDWVKFNTDDDGNFYSKGNIGKSKGKYIVRVWYKKVYSEKGREKEIQWRKKGGLSTIGYDTLSETRYLVEIDCKTQMTNIVSVYDYNTNGEVLHFSNYDDKDWSYPPPDSMGDYLQKTLCK